MPTKFDSSTDLGHCVHNRHSVKWSTSLSHTFYIRDVINALPINWYLMWAHYIGAWWWHPLALWDEVTIANVITGTTHHHKPEPCPTADTMVWPLGTEWPQITRITPLLTAAWSCNIHTYTRSYHCVGVRTLYCWLFVVCKNQERVAPDYESSVIWRKIVLFLFLSW